MNENVVSNYANFVLMCDDAELIAARETCKQIGLVAHSSATHVEAYKAYHALRIVKAAQYAVDLSLVGKQ